MVPSFIYKRGGVFASLVINYGRSKANHPYYLHLLTLPPPPTGWTQHRTPNRPTSPFSVFLNHSTTTTTPNSSGWSRRNEDGFLRLRCQRRWIHRCRWIKHYPTCKFHWNGSNNINSHRSRVFVFFSILGLYIRCASCKTILTTFRESQPFPSMITFFSP